MTHANHLRQEVRDVWETHISVKNRLNFLVVNSSPLGQVLLRNPLVHDWTIPENIHTMDSFEDFQGEGEGGVGRGWLFL